MKNTIVHITSFAFSLADLFFTKKFLVFSSRSAKDYADNAKSLYETFLSHGDENVYFYTKSKSVLKNIPKNGVYAYSIKGIYCLLRSKILIFTHGISDFQPYFPKKHNNRIFINLFHAIAVKKVGGESLSVEQINQVTLWDYFLVSSEFESKFIRQQFDLKKKQMLVFGQPRNDVLISTLNNNTSPKKLILYAPTFRESSSLLLFPFEDKNLLKLDQYLEKNNLQIMIRLHINDQKKYKNNSDFIHLKNIFFAGSDQIPTINDFLHQIDFLITDYSSIALDYLLLDRPIAYIPYDYTSYEKERGFSFDYFDHLAGPVLKSQRDLLSFLKKDHKEFKVKRSLLKEQFHQHQNGQSSERLYQFIKTL